MHTDPISDFLTRIRNAAQAKHEVVACPASKIKIAIAQVMKQEGFIRDFKCIRDQKQGVIKIALKYSDEGDSAIRDVTRVSTPSRRVYCALQEFELRSKRLGHRGLLDFSRSYERPRSPSPLS